MTRNKYGKATPKYLLGDDCVAAFRRPSHLSDGDYKLRHLKSTMFNATMAAIHDEIASTTGYDNAVINEALSRVEGPMKDYAHATALLNEIQTLKQMYYNYNDIYSHLKFYSNKNALFAVLEVEYTKAADLQKKALENLDVICKEFENL